INKTEYRTASSRASGACVDSDRAEQSSAESRASFARLTENRALDRKSPDSLMLFQDPQSIGWKWPMDHWFDNLAKGVALGRLSRRAALGGVFTGLAAAFSGCETQPVPSPPGGGPPPKPPGPPIPIPTKGPCLLTTDGTHQTLSLRAETKFAGKSLAYRHSVTTGVARSQEVTINETITLGGAVVLQVDAGRSVSGQTRVTRGTITFVEIVTGIRTFSFY